ncbi:hypothetical protein K1T71_009444 [Dendrolimus kikuchii]|uniref:Uncharacterized protein n=1 Tax=Dendrolimus kikuchii TaxID=765133 RepID=A0ACC1CUU2_9NEOP|nr:hypothetical protein K1T71_009444 [Dendrolimus kikuchii]
MEHVKVCRICLITDVKMFNLRSYPLCTYFETIIGGHPFSITAMPPYVCYVCVAHIQKYYNFRSKCLKGQTALYDIIQAKGVVMTDNIKQIDREALKLTSTLTKVHQNLTLVIKEDNVEIKDEPVTDIESKDHLSFDINIVKKEDIDDAEIDYPLPSASSSDDEELPVSVELDKRIPEINNRKISMNYQPVYQCNFCYKSFLEARVWKSHTAKHDPMDEENQIDDKLKRKRELTNERVKRHRKKKRTESQQQPTEEKQNKQIKENNAERKKALAKERSRRYREKKRLNVSKSVPRVDHDSQVPGLSHGIPPLVLINERTMIHDSQIAGTSTNMDVPLVIRENHRTTILR